MKVWGSDSGIDFARWEVLASVFAKFFRRRRASRENADLEALRLAFKERYHHFKLLLNANNTALDLMAQIEEALQGTKPFGMAFVRSRCTRITASVFQIVKHLTALAPGKYSRLHAKFIEIQEKIRPFVTKETGRTGGPMALLLADTGLSSADEIGGKMANLAEIGRRLNLAVPDGFALTVSAYHRFLSHNDLQAEIDRRIQASPADRLDALYGLSAAIQQLIIQAPLPDELERIIAVQCRRFDTGEGKKPAFALRSSAFGEDSTLTSYAGQYRSLLNVALENVAQGYREIVASKYSLQAITYRLNHGIADEDVAMSVGVMRMVDAVCGGVLYSSDPLGDGHIIINSVWGLPKPVVDGSENPDQFVFSRSDLPEMLKKDIALKTHMLVCNPEEGVSRMALAPEKGESPSLEDQQAENLARIAIRLERYYGTPQDIEWAVDPDGRIVILQCRPLRQAQVLSRNAVAEAAVPLLQGGITAGPGTASGPVYIVRKDMDALQFPEGSVLVARQPLPRLAILLNRSTAVITEQGGVAGHLATVAREFQVPALFGVKNAANQLKNGQIVTVDADGRRVYDGRIEALLGKEAPPPVLMQGGRVYDTLKDVSRNILPLNLMDPDSPDFKPENCRTYHDITRFCHEKSVVEMFQFGKDHDFPERSSKQLLCEIPMQWWVLNLDDGFGEEEEGKYVRLENIVSIPMLALWEGITAFPWQGPPAVDGKGLLSVMFEATTNPSLVTGVPSKYADRNYFMISKHYCSLSSRLGFHLSIVEALVSDRAAENYVSFQFKGGAADLERRNKRILFLLDILEENGFRAEARDDYLSARLENLEMAQMAAHLRILGYLTIHTRQLDMIMSDRDQIERYRSRIMRDTAAIADPAGRNSSEPGET